MTSFARKLANYLQKQRLTLTVVLLFAVAGCGIVPSQVPSFYPTPPPPPVASGQSSPAVSAHPSPLVVTTGHSPMPVTPGQSTPAVTASLSTPPVSAGPPTSTATSSQSPAADVGQPYIDGNLLRYSDGSRFVVDGASAYLIPFYASSSGGPDGGLSWVFSLQYPVRDAMFAHMKSMGINTVRVSVSTDCYTDTTCGYSLGGKAGYLKILQDYVQSASAQGLYVIFGWWQDGSQLPTHYADAFPMMADVRNAIGDNPYVMYEPWNEPNNISGAQWETVIKATLVYYRNTLHYTGVLFVDTTGWSWDFSSIVANVKNVQAEDAQLLGRSNVIFANHRYANSNQTFSASEENAFNNSVGDFTQTYPIVGTEYGFYNGGNSYWPQWDAGFFNYLTSTMIPQKGMNGAVIFNYLWVDSNTLNVNDPAKLSDQGQIALSDFWSKLTGL
jgi:hypothetical protein